MGSTFKYFNTAAVNKFTAKYFVYPSAIFLEFHQSLRLHVSNKENNQCQPKAHHRMEPTK